MASATTALAQPGTKPGACCLDVDGDGINESCTVTSESACNSFPGTFHGVGSACLGTGACCFGIVGGDCVEVDGICCTGLSGGSFHGVGSVCLGDSNLNGLDDQCECVADVNDDGTVDILDLLDLLGEWGPCPGPGPEPCPADLNFDGTVNIVDLLDLLGNWGPCP